jgi:predicted nucleic acid-binding protein
MLVDADVLIWHLRGYPQATRRLDELGALTLSAVSYLEVLQGMRNKAELVAVKKMLDKRSAKLLPVTESVTLRALIGRRRPAGRGVLALSRRHPSFNTTAFVCTYSRTCSMPLSRPKPLIL